MSAYDVHGSAAEVAWLRSEIAQVQADAVARGLDALAVGAGKPPEVQEAALRVALGELMLGHGHAVALEADLIRRGAA